MLGAVDFTTRRHVSLRVEPWIVPLVTMDSTDEVPDAFVRQTNNLDRDMIVLRPGESYTGFIRVPEDSIVRLQDLTVTVRERVDGRYLTISEPTTDKQWDDQAAAILLMGNMAVDGYASELLFSLVDAGAGTVLAEERNPIPLVLAKTPRPGGADALLSHLLPQRGILQFTITHVGLTPVLCVSGVFRGARVIL